MHAVPSSPSSSVSSVATLRSAFARLQQGHTASADAISELLRAPTACITLSIALLHEELDVGGAATPPIVVLAAQLLQKCMRRAPLHEVSGCSARLVELARRTSSLGWAPVLTQVAMALGILLWRDPSVVEPLQSLPWAEAERDVADRAVVIAVLRLVAEELHAPARARLSPVRRGGYLRVDA